MTESFAKEDGNTDLWTTIFAHGHPDLTKQQTLHARLPRDPRCRMCYAPFAGLGGMYMRWRGKSPSSRNPHYCSACDGFLDAFPGGAEVEMSVLFVDIRNSVPFAQDHAPQDVARRTNRFLNDATRAITNRDGFIMAFYGDCIVAVWPPGFSGPNHRAHAVAAARDLLKLSAKAEQAKLGVGVNTGPIYICTVQAAKGLFRDVSIFGHEVNLCARLAAKAGPGEALIAANTAQNIDPMGPGALFDLKGIDGQTEAFLLTS